MTAILVPAILLLLVLAATLFATDSRDGHDWTPSPRERVARRGARRVRTS